MSDDLKHLEAQLAARRPLAVSPHLATRMAEQLDARTEHRLSFADRCLATAMSCGAIAACVIVGLMTWQMSEHAPSGGTVSLAARAGDAAPTRQPWGLSTDDGAVVRSAVRNREMKVSLS